MKKIIVGIIFSLMCSIALAFSAAGHGGGGHSSGGHSSSHASSHISSAHAESAHTTVRSIPIIPHGATSSTGTYKAEGADAKRLENCEVVDEDKMCAKYKKDDRVDTFFGVLMAALGFAVLFAGGLGIASLYYE